MRDHSFLVELFHVAIIRAVIDADEPEVLCHFLFGIFQIPSTDHGAISDMGHTGPVHAVMAVEKDRLTGGVADNFCGFFELIRDKGTCVVASDVVDGQVNPGHAGFFADPLFHLHQWVIVWMGQSHDGFEVVLANDPAEGDGLLPATSKDFARLDFHKFAGQDIVVPVLPGLLAGHAYGSCSKHAPKPLSPVFRHDHTRE